MTKREGAVTRKGLTDGRQAEEARKAVARHFRRLTNQVGVNLAQFRAQLHEEEMVELLVGLARGKAVDQKGEAIDVPVSVRRQCMIDVLTFARGPIRPWLHDGETIDPSMPAPGGGTMGDAITATRATADTIEEMADLVARQVPPSAWPDHVREAAAASALYSELVTEDEEQSSG